MTRHVRHGDVALALNRLVRQGVIVSFRTNFADKNEPGWMPEVIARIPAGADQAATLERVEGTILPLGVSRVTLEPDEPSRSTP